MKNKIIQIIPAPADLRAICKNEDGNTAGMQRVAALALVEDAGGFRYVTGLCAGEDMSPVEEIDGFMGFSFGG